MDRPLDPTLPVGRPTWLAPVGFKVVLLATIMLGLVLGTRAMTRDETSVSVTTIRSAVPVSFGTFSVDRVRKLRGVAIPARVATSTDPVVLEVGVTLTNLSDQPIRYSSPADFRLHSGHTTSTAAFAHSTNSGRIEQMRARKIVLYYAVDRRDRDPLAFSYLDPAGDTVRVELGRIRGIDSVRATPYGRGHHH